jgi:hypothetical protein
MTPKELIKDISNGLTMSTENINKLLKFGESKIAAAFKTIKTDAEADLKKTGIHFSTKEDKTVVASGPHGTAEGKNQLEALNNYTKAANDKVKAS